MDMQDVRLKTGEDVSEKLQLAKELARLARRDEALEQLTHCEDWPQPLNEQGLITRAEVLARRSPVDALEMLAAHSESFTTSEGRFAYFVTSANAYANSRGFDEARNMLHTARELVQDDLIRAARLGYERARLAVITGEYDPLSDDVALAMSDPSPGAQFKALELRSWMYAGREEYSAQVRDLVAALERFGQSRSACDVTSVATALHTQLRLALELGDDTSLKAGEAAYEMIAWTSDIAHLQFLCLRTLAWHAFISGDSGRAQWLFKDSKDVAPTLAWQVMSHADRAFVARMNCNEAWAAEELAIAQSIASEVEWDATHGEERQALIMLAELAAPTDMALAQRYVASYIQLGQDSLDPTLADGRTDRRRLAYDKYAAGRVQSVLGNVKIARDSLELAYDIFTQSGYNYRAALAAGALFEVTEDITWLEKARSQALKFPKSPLYRRLLELDKVEEQRVLSGLTQMQRQLAIAFSQGAGLDDLSLRFSRSRFTISKQIETIFEELGVNSRHTLRAELRQRGIL